MSTTSTNSTPQLQPPGMGLPKWELYMARILVAVKLKVTSQRKASNNFASETQKILSFVDHYPSDLASTRVLIDRLPGLEDSSRYWSLHMTLEHLRIVNRFSIDVIESLLKGVRPQTLVSTAAVKPCETASKEVVSLFKSVCEEFQSLFPENRNLKSKVTLAHPWFGELNAEEWHFFAGFHMTLHRKQLLKIGEKLSALL